MDEILSKAGEWMVALEAATVSLAPQALELAMTVARIQAIQTFVLWCAGTLLWFSLCFVGLRVAAEGVKNLQADDYASRQIAEPQLGFGGVIAVLSGLIGTVVLFNFNAFALIGMFQPEVWIAYRLMP